MECDLSTLNFNTVIRPCQEWTDSNESKKKDSRALFISLSLSLYSSLSLSIPLSPDSIIWTRFNTIDSNDIPLLQDIPI